MRFPLSSKAKLLHSLSLSSRSLRAGFATRKSSRLPSATSRTSPRLSPSPSIRRPLINQLKTQNSKAGPDQTPPSQVSVSNALRDTKAEDNNLLSPVYLPEDPDGVLNEKHPATSILANSAIVVQRQLELMNVMIGFEQANKYVILDPQGNHVGFIAERDLGMGNMMARQMFSTHRSFTTHVFDKYEKEVLRFHRPFSWISSRIGVYDPLEVAYRSHSSSQALSTINPGPLSPDRNQASAQVSSLAISEMRIIGEAQQQWAPLRRKYNLFLFRRPPTPETDLGTRRLPVADLPLSTSQKLQVTQLSKNKDEGEYGQFAYVDEPFLSWDFSLLSADSRLIGSVNRNFAGFGREIFTDTGVYALRMDAAGLAAEPQHLISKTGQKSELAYNGSNAGMTLDQRAVMLATAVSVDFDYFSRKSGSGGFMPMWFPWWGGGAGETAGGVAGAEAAGGAVEGMGTSAAGGLARGAGGIGEGAAVGAGSMAGYEAMQRGTYGSDSSPTTGQSPSPGQAPSQQGADVEGEEVWGEHDAPWGEGKGGSGGERGSGDGGEGGEGGDWFDPSEWF